MFKKGLFILFAIFCSVSIGVKAQVIDSTEVKDAGKDLPPVSYDNPKKYEIAEIKVSGVTNPMYEDYTILGFAQLQVGDKIEIPGSEITNAIKRFWKLGLFSHAEIEQTKIEGNKVWLEIKLKERPRISDIVYTGMKKGERQDIEAKIGMVKNLQVTPNQMDKARSIIKKYFAEKGFNNAEITLSEQPDLSNENQVILNIDVVKKNKTKVNKIAIEGNSEVKSSTLEKAMKKTRHKSNFSAWLRNFLRSTKYVPESYEEDKDNLIAKYNELGYRDATITWDTVYADVNNPNKVDIQIKVDEGKQYFIKDINWVGNTIYPTWDMQRVLNMKPGDVYNQKKLLERLSGDEDAVMNLFYQNKGYLFSGADPVEVNIGIDTVKADSTHFVDLEIRIHEGQKATIRKVSISGNDRVYEDVVRRELRLKPGALYSRDDIIRSLREIAQTGHFDPENLEPRIDPDPESGTVDIGMALVSKANDQVEFSAGWGQTGIIGKLSLRFSNFSLKNLLNPKSYKGIIPQGEGQTLTLSAQTNAKFYQSYSISFMDPWFGGKRPNSFSVGAYYSRQTDINSRYINDNYGYYNPYSYGYGNYGGGYGDYSAASDPNKSIQMIGASIGYGKRLNWPDEYFFLQAELSYQLYQMKDWAYFIVKDGVCNNLSVNFSLNRKFIDNPVYTRQGTDISLSLQITPPFSLFDGKDYANMKADENGYEPGDKFKWIEYHKWKFRAKTFTPLLDPDKEKRTPVLMTRAEYGFVGYFNKNKKSPFETFYVGGDGMSGYSSTYATETIGLRGYENGSLGTQASAYSRLALELRYPLILEPSSTIYILTFAEAGNAWYDLKKFNPFDLKRSAGVGARIMLPMIGLMGIDWAYGFDAINGDRSRSGSNFHFVIGQEF